MDKRVPQGFKAKLELKDKAGQLAFAATPEIKATKEALGRQELME